MNKSLEKGIPQAPEVSQPTETQNREGSAQIGLSDGGHDAEDIQRQETVITNIDTRESGLNRVREEAAKLVARSLAGTPATETRKATKGMEASELLDIRKQELEDEIEALKHEMEAAKLEGQHLFDIKHHAQMDHLGKLITALDHVIEASNDEHIVQKAIERLAAHKQEQVVLEGETFDEAAYTESSSIIKTAQNRVESLREQVRILQEMA